MRPLSLEPGVQIGDFRVEGRLGAGAMGVVYRARQTSLNRVVALKVLDRSLAQATGIARFQRAAQAAARLRHPNIAIIHTVGLDEGISYLAMEYIDGASLQRAIPRLAAAPSGVKLRLPEVEGGAADGGHVVSVTVDIRGAASPGQAPATPSEFPTLDLLTLALDGPPSQPAPPEGKNAPGEESTADLPGAVGSGPDLTITGSFLVMLPLYHRLCCQWVRDAARGVQHAHDLGVIHRDLKPGNLMLGRDGRVRVIDFGLARCFEDATLTATGQLTGTPLYMSPEQVTGRIGLSGKTDIYSLGLVLYELLTLGPPITARTREELFLRIITKPLQPLTQVNPTVSAAIEAVVHKATAKSPDKRYVSAGAFAEDLGRVLAGKPVTAPAYRPEDEEAELLNTRPAVIPVVAAQLYVAVFMWVAYGGFLMSVKDAPGRHRISMPLLSLGWYGAALAYGIAGLLALAAVWMSRGYRYGYWVGLCGQLALIASVLTLGITANILREIEGDRLLRIVVFALVTLLWLGGQLLTYIRPAVRSWFHFARQLRRKVSGDWFRGRTPYVR
jgi:hypothetical protein